jgi:hypothetical protein
MIFWLVLTLEICYYRVIVFQRILVSFRGFFAIICFGGNFSHFEDKFCFGINLIFFSIVQFGKKLQNFWKNSPNFWNEKNEKYK